VEIGGDTADIDNEGAVTTRLHNRRERAQMSWRYEMLLKDYKKTDPKYSNDTIVCNALFKTQDSVNCYLTPTQAMALAQHLLQKAQLILNEHLEDAVVQLWNTGKENEQLHCGLIEARKGPRKIYRKSGGTDERVKIEGASPCASSLYWQGSKEEK